MPVRKSGIRAKRGKRAGDGLSTTGTQYGETSPDYVKQAGDPDYLKSYSEEQIGMLGGRASIFERVAAKEARASGFGDPADTTSNQESTLTTETPSSLSEGPTTAPTTYGSSEMPKPGKKTPQKAGGKNKGRLNKRLAKTTGTTTGEAKGIMKNVRKQVRAGNKAKARKTLKRALSGGPRAGVPRSPQRSRKAAAAASKITGRIAERQKAAAPKLQASRGTPSKRRKK